MKDITLLEEFKKIYPEKFIRRLAYSAISMPETGYS